MKNQNKAKSLNLLFLLLFALSIVSVANAQTWNSNAGGYNGGYGQVYQSFGMAQATINMQNQMNMTIQKAMMRSAMEKKWGKKTVAEAEAKANRTSSTAKSTQATTQSVVNNYAFFKTDKTIDTGRLMADTLGETDEEKQLVRQIYTGTKTAFEKEVEPKGWKNNIAAALTFFMVTSAVVYHDTAEPSDEGVNNLFQALNQTIDEIPEFGQLPNRDKQEFYNKMIGFSGLLLAGYAEGKQNGDEATVKTYGKLAGVLIEMILKTSPDKIQIKNGYLVMQ